MNLTGRPVYQKGQTKKKNNRATAAQRRRWAQLLTLGCVIPGCKRAPKIHHAETGGGGRKDHDKVFPLCHYHHQGKQGIHTLSRKKWEPMYETERYFLDFVAKQLRVKFPSA